jgi:hypothetical protein
MNIAFGKPSRPRPSRDRTLRTRRRRPSLETLEERQLLDASPFRVGTGDPYLGAAIARGNERYDLQPSILYDPTDTYDGNGNQVPDRLFKMWWLGRYEPGDPPRGIPADTDVPQPANFSLQRPDGFIPQDRIYYSYSETGGLPGAPGWSPPKAVLKGLGGTGGSLSADDHLLGSPSVLKLGGEYVMFYEAFATAATVVNRFYSYNQGDT